MLLVDREYWRVVAAVAVANSAHFFSICSIFSCAAALLAPKAALALARQAAPNASAPRSGMLGISRWTRDGPVTPIRLATSLVYCPRYAGMARHRRHSSNPPRPFVARGAIGRAFATHHAPRTARQPVSHLTYYPCHCLCSFALPLLPLTSASPSTSTLQAHTPGLAERGASCWRRMRARVG